ARSEITEPHAGHEIRGQMRAVEVQGERRPGAPPLARLYARRIQFADVECVQPHHAVRQRPGDAEQHRRVGGAADPGVRIETRRWWWWRRGAVLACVLQQVA